MFLKCLSVISLRIIRLEIGIYSAANASHLNIIGLRTSLAKMLEVIKCKMKGFIISIYAMVEIEINFLRHGEVGKEVKDVVLPKDFSIIKHVLK